MLLGQNVNSYGKDLTQKLILLDLLEQIDSIEGLNRIRYTSHPRDFSDKLINVIANSTKVCEHFHLPIQAGSSRILKQMRRGYTKEKYLELVENQNSSSQLYFNYGYNSWLSWRDRRRFLRNYRCNKKGLV